MDLTKWIVSFWVFRIATCSLTPTGLPFRLQMNNFAVKPPLTGTKTGSSNRMLNTVEPYPTILQLNESNTGNYHKQFFYYDTGPNGTRIISITESFTHGATAAPLPVTSTLPILKQVVTSTGASQYYSTKIPGKLNRSVSSIHPVVINGNRLVKAGGSTEGGSAEHIHDDGRKGEVIGRGDGSGKRWRVEGDEGRLRGTRKQLRSREKAKKVHRKRKN
ncbi:hypothetical protein BV898_13746 [Hypsibius exemplaris]|uniref:Uncharacterized protein n=1 Tax=Hypsibius exemplaris TaxID=2072580 RepID=A0A1W0W9R5_HYPEX|nr:hypothetical protein BV898_13746 [Hypsibius exemplaris]